MQEEIQKVVEALRARGSIVPISNLQPAMVMINSEKILKDMNLRLALFGNPDAANQAPSLPESITSSDIHRLYRETVSKLVFRIE